MQPSGCGELTDKTLSDNNSSPLPRLNLWTCSLGRGSSLRSIKFRGSQSTASERLVYVVCREMFVSGEKVFQNRPTIYSI